jgi:hypothetical protein
MERAAEATDIATEGQRRSHTHEATAYQPLQELPGGRHTYLELAGQQGGGQCTADDAEIQHRGRIQVRGDDLAIRDAHGVEEPIPPVAHPVRGAPGFVEGEQEDIQGPEEHAADPHWPLLAEYLRIAPGKGGSDRFRALLCSYLGVHRASGNPGNKGQSKGYQHPPGAGRAGLEACVELRAELASSARFVWPLGIALGQLPIPSLPGGRTRIF